MPWLLNELANKLLNVLFLLLILTLFLIIMQRNPVYAVFSFILTALLVFTLLLLMGAEFFALLILIIYTGVITVLFLFVVIMYNLRDIQLYIHNILFSPFFVLVYAKVYWLNTIFKEGYIDVLKQAVLNSKKLNTWELDVVQFTALFNDHYFLFIMVGILLFIAMIGSIVITYPFFKYQK